MINLFQLLDTSFSVDWDPDTLLNDIEIISSNDSKWQPPITEKNRAFWQFVPQYGAFVMRGFEAQFPDHANQILQYIRGLQKKASLLTNKTKIIEQFLQHEPVLTNVGLIANIPNSSITLHCDKTCSISINLGLKNSHTCRTHVYDGEIIPNTLIDEKNVKYSYQMNDGDAYILNVLQPHFVEYIGDHSKKEKRYIIRYKF